MDRVPITSLRKKKSGQGLLIKRIPTTRVYLMESKIDIIGTLRFFRP